MEIGVVVVSSIVESWIAGCIKQTEQRIVVIQLIKATDECISAHPKCRIKVIGGR